MARPQRIADQDNVAPLPDSHDPWQPVALVLLGILTLAVALWPAVISVLPELYFDVDPRSSEALAVNPVLGPSAMTWLATAAMLLAGASLAVHHGAGRRVHWGSLALAIIGMGFAAVYVDRDFANMYQCAAWLHAISCGIAMLHLAQHPPVRTLAVATLMGLIAPYTLDALMYVFVEHPATLDMFKANQEEFLQARGWAPDSPQAKAYERRMSFADATGPFGLSNVFGSVVGALLFIAACRAAAAVRARALPGAIWPACLALAGLLTVLLTNSRGALLAVAVVAGLVVVTAVIAFKLPKLRKLIPALAMLAIAAAFAAVLVRGGLGPPQTPEGDRSLSLLFRFHYWQAAADIVAEHPVTGVGPGSFQEAYSLHKNPINPEEVTSAHNVFVDYISTIGLGGLALSALLLMWLWVAGRGVCDRFDDLSAIDDDRPDPADQRPANERMQVHPVHLAMGLLTALLIFVPQFVVELPKMVPEASLLWALGMIAVLATILVALEAQPSARARGFTQLGLFAAGALLLVHNQIETTFFHAGSASLAILVLAVAAAGGLRTEDDVKPGVAAAGSAGDEVAPPAAPSQGRTAAAYGMGMLFVIFAFAYGVAVAAPVTAQQSAMKRAAEQLREQHVMEAMQSLGEAIVIWPRHPRPYRSLVQLRIEYAGYLAQHGNNQEAAAQAQRAMQLLDKAESAGLNSAVILRLRAQAIERIAIMQRQPPTDAVPAYERVLALQPHSIQDHVRLADLLWTLERHAEARKLYERTLKLSENAYLDPLRQLSAADKARVEARLEEGRS